MNYFSIFVKNKQQQSDEKKEAFKRDRCNFVVRTERKDIKFFENPEELK